MRAFFFSIILLSGFLSLGNNNDSILSALDRKIEESKLFSEQKEIKLNKLRQQLQTLSNNSDRFEVTSMLYREFKSYKYDSAYAYAERMLKYAQLVNNSNLICESKIALGFSCVSAGLYKEAAEISLSVDTTNIDISHKADYYSFLSTLNLSMSDFAATEPYFSQYRMSSLKYCRNFIALLDKDSPEAILAKMRESQLMENYPQAIKYAERYLSLHPKDMHDYAIAMSMLAFFYEVQKDTSKAIECFAKAATADIEMAIKETSAIRQLAELLYLKKDITHAYSYSMEALDNANFYNARQRKIEVGRTLPIIEAGRFEIIEKQKNKLLIFSGLISMLFILFVIATFIILKQKQRLNKARILILKQNSELLETNTQLTQIQKEISKQNIDLKHINEKLKEVHRIKDEYIGYFFSANSSYIEKKEEYQKMILRKIKNGHSEELVQQLTINELRKEKEEMFSLFDQIFMKLFPNFIDRYNQLFNESDQVSIKNGGSLTPEIRIFALIRLGITESERIAKFLDFSVSTVKNYKTKAKNRSIVQNELFEHKIMEIESVTTDIQGKNEYQPDSN